MSLTVHVYCNGVEQGYVEVSHGETNDSLYDKISKEFGIKDFVFEERFNAAILCQDDNIYICYDKVVEARNIVEKYITSEERDNCGDEIFIQAIIDADMINDKIDRFDNGNTALYITSFYGYHDAVKTLIATGADVNMYNKHKYTTLYIASAHGNNDIVQTLIKAGADINFKNNYGETALNIASLRGHNNIVRMLIAAGADVNNAKCDGNTSLHYASANGHCDIVQMLIAAGADVNIKTDDEHTALDNAYKFKRDDIVQILIAAGANN